MDIVEIVAIGKCNVGREKLDGNGSSSSVDYQESTEEEKTW